MTDTFAAEIAQIGADDRLRIILEEACRISGMGFAAIACVTESRWVACQVLDQIEFGLNPGDELEIQTTICDEIRKTGNMVVIDDVREHFEWRRHCAPDLYGFNSYISIPIILSNGLYYGNLCLLDPAPRNVSAPDTVTALERLADTAGQILWILGAAQVMSVNRVGAFASNMTIIRT